MAEAKLWLGLLLTATDRGPHFDFERPARKSTEWMGEMGLLADEVDEVPEVACDLTGIVYRTDRNELLADFNHSGDSRLRAVLRASLQERAEPSHRDQTVRLRIANKLGLHARPSAKFVHALHSVFGDHPPIWAVKGDEAVDARNLLGLLLLTACYGSIVELRFSESDPEKLLAFLKLIHATPLDDAADEWRCDFGERAYANGRVEYALDV
jgi:phosphotransferase system HPr (HPr) family protein